MSYPSLIEDVMHPQILVTSHNHKSKSPMPTDTQQSVCGRGTTTTDDSPAATMPADAQKQHNNDYNHSNNNNITSKSHLCMSFDSVIDAVVGDCQQRGLTTTSVWLCDLATYATPTLLSTVVPVPPSIANNIMLHQNEPILRRIHLQGALALFHKGEYRRCHHMLVDQQYHSVAATTTCTTTTSSMSAKGVPLVFQDSIAAFLACYALYLDGERVKTALLSGTTNVVAVTDAITTTNPSLKDTLNLIRTLMTSPLSASMCRNDSYLCWLEAVVHREMGAMQEHVCGLIDAVKLNPFLWCAWEDLAKQISDISQLADIIKATTVVMTLEKTKDHGHEHDNNCHNSSSSSSQYDHNKYTSYNNQHLLYIVRTIFGAFVKFQLSLFLESLTDTKALLYDTNIGLPNHPYLICLVGRCYSARKDLEEAKKVYAALHERHPYRLDSMDDYSSILFMLGDSQVLTTLAQECFSIDPFRAECNFIVGNLYACIQKHDRALYYFKRAVQINPQMSSAWTLLGHEYIELKNTNAAAEAYRAAIRVNKRDHLNWYSLGQVYEVHRMHQFALHYYWHAVKLKPMDPRMWQALATCMEKSRRPTIEVVRCLENAEACEPSNTEHYYKIARRIAVLYATIDVDKSASFMEKTLDLDYVTDIDQRMFLPLLVRYYTERAAKGLTVRALSYDPTSVTCTADIGSSGVNNYCCLNAQQKIDHMRYLDMAENYVSRLEEYLLRADDSSSNVQLELNSERLVEFQNRIRQVRIALENC